MTPARNIFSDEILTMAKRKLTWNSAKPLLIFFHFCAIKMVRQKLWMILADRSSCALVKVEAILSRSEELIKTAQRDKQAYNYI